MDSIKCWLIEYGIKKFGPSALRAGIGALLAWALAHQGVLESFGVYYDTAAQTITLHLDRLNAALDVSLLALIGGAIKVIHHQGAALVTQQSEKASP